ncbi:laccase domain-containing protein [Arsenophonus endosymbiont of Bemisia tabaci]|nr:laccase domain-containing protein [Arsenophonus endosymbiont of Bemisia tabaci]CAA2929510.1 Laccase domain protein YfiH [Arsenophonus endosymbiont of Bemisia tabaci Q2]
MTADCLPVLLCNQQGTEIAAVHAVAGAVCVTGSWKRK